MRPDKGIRPNFRSGIWMEIGSPINNQQAKDFEKLVISFDSHQVGADPTKAQRTF